MAEAGIFWLSKLRKPWLLVLDNADDPELDLSALMPVGDRGHILITSRNPSFRDYATAGTLHLNKMDPEEAIELLLRLSFPQDLDARAAQSSRTHAMGIADRLGYLAIALNHAGATIRRKIFTIEKYLTSYLARQGFLINPRLSISPAETEIITTWEIPFRKMEAKAKRSAIYQDAVGLLHIFAFLHHQAIPEHLLLASSLSPELDLPVPEGLPDIFSQVNPDEAIERARLRQTLHILADYSIIEFNDDACVCSMHPVIHAWARSRIDDPQMINHWLRCTAYLLARAGSQLEASQMNAIPLLQHADGFLELVEMDDRKDVLDPDHAVYLEYIAKIYERAGRWKRAFSLSQHLMRIRMASLGRIHADTLRAKRSASLCAWNLFEVQQAIELQHEILLAHWRRRPSFSDWLHPIQPMHMDYLLTLSDLTQTLWLAGQRQLSRRAGERALSGLQIQLGSEHPAVLTTAFNLGRTYRHLGMLQEAHLLLIWVLKQRTVSLGSTHLETLMVKSEVAMNFCSRKVYLALAEKWMRQVHQIRAQVLGEEHAYTLWSINDLSKILVVRGRFQEAAEILEEIIPAVARTLGKKHVGMQMTKGNLARAYASCHRWQGAAENLESVVPDIDQRHPDWAHSWLGLTRLYVRLHALDKAEAQCLQALTHFESSSAEEQSWWSRYRPATILSRLFSVADVRTSEAQQHINTFAGVLAEVFKLKDDKIKLSSLRTRYPNLVDDILQQPFELT